MTESTEALVDAAQEADEDKDDEEQGCLQKVLKLKGVGFLDFVEVERALRRVRKKSSVDSQPHVGVMNRLIDCLNCVCVCVCAHVCVQDHLSKEAVEALFDAMGGLITDASFEVLQRRMGEIVGEDREAVRARLVSRVLRGEINPPIVLGLTAPPPIPSLNF